MTKQLVVFGTAVMSTLLALAALWQFRIVVIYVLVSLALAATVRPLIKNWSKHSFGRKMTLIFLYLVGLVSFGFLIFFIGRFSIGDIQQLAQMLAAQGTWTLPRWLEGGSFQQALVAWLPTPNKLFEAVIGEQGQLVLPAVLNFTQGIGGVVSGFLAILFLSIYWSINQIYFERLWLSLLPSEQRKQARDAWRTIELDLGAYIRSELIQSCLAALLLGFGYWLLGSPYPILLALIGALAWLIPVVGAAIAMIPPLLIGMMTSVQLSVFTSLFTLIILIALQVWVEPRLFRRKWDNNPILTLVILLAMADAFGLLGILVAPPLSAVCQILWSHLVSRRAVLGDAAQVSDLKERQARLWDSIKAMNEPPLALVTSSMERLSQLIEKAEPILPTPLLAEPSEPFHPSQPVATEGGTSVSKTT